MHKTEEVVLLEAVLFVGYTGDKPDNLETHIVQA